MFAVKKSSKTRQMQKQLIAADIQTLTDKWTI